MSGLLLLFILLLLLSAFFSCAEAAMLSLSKLQVRRLLKQQRRNARLVEKLKADSHRLLETILIGNTLVNIAAAALATSWAIATFGDTGIGIATGVTTFLVLILGEVIPKTLGVSHPSAVALAISPFLYVIEALFTPLLVVIDWFAKLFAKLFGEPERELFTKDEVRDVVVASEHEGHLKAGERMMIQNVLKLDERNAGEVMTPRLDVFCLEMHKKVDEVIDAILVEGYSRVPVYDTKMDQMRGVVLVKDLLKVVEEGRKGLSLEEVMQPLLVVPENKKLDGVLREFQRRKAALAIVMDEHGLFIGIVTIEDVLEELVGEIYDENDLQESEAVRQLEDDSLLVSGKTLIAELNEKHGLAIPESDDYDTLAGFLMNSFGRIPRQGEELKTGSLRLTVERAAQHRVVTVRVMRLERKQQEAPLSAATARPAKRRKKRG